MERTQRSFADIKYENKKRKTRREQFLDRVEILIPWEKLLEKITMLYEVESVRRFCGIRLGKVLDETTILNFRHLLEYNELGKNLFETIKDHLAGHGFLLKKGTILDASIIEAPSSTKNRSGERDPEMKQTRKENQWHFGMKLHIGVDDQSGLVHSMETTSANVHDLSPSEKLLHGEEAYGTSEEVPTTSTYELG